MKHQIRVVGVLICACVLFAATGCGDDDDSGDDQTAESTQTGSDAGADGADGSVDAAKVSSCLEGAGFSVLSSPSETFVAAENPNSGTQLTATVYADEKEAQAEAEAESEGLEASEADVDGTVLYLFAKTDRDRVEMAQSCVAG